MSDGEAPGLDGVFLTGAAAWPAIDLPRADFEVSWARACRRPGVPLGDPDRVADLYLAAACDHGTRGAWEEFARVYGPRLHGLLRVRGATQAEAAELVADLPGFLCEPPASGAARTRIGTYDGAGRLFSWLAVLALRGLHQRRQAREARHARLEGQDDLATRRGAPAQSTLSAEAAARFGAAVASAWAGLTPRERLAVLWKHRDGLRGREIARLLGVGEPRVSRLLESGLSRLRDAVRRRMPETPPGTSTPDESVWRALHGVLVRHLATLPPAPHEPGEAP